MFYSETSYKRIEQIQKRDLRIVYNEPQMSLEELLIRDQGIVSIVSKKITEIYKNIFRGRSLFYEKHFHEKRCNIQSKNIKSLNLTQN